MISSMVLQDTTFIRLKKQNFPNRKRNSWNSLLCGQEGESVSSNFEKESVLLMELPPMHNESNLDLHKTKNFFSILY